LKIPNRFKMLGHTVEVVFVDELTDREDCIGLVKYREGKILLQKVRSHRPQTQIEYAFCHELVHWALHFMSEDELDNNERFVSTMGELLYQALTTMEFDKET